MFVGSSTKASPAVEEREGAVIELCRLSEVIGVGVSMSGASSSSKCQSSRSGGKGQMATDTRYLKSTADSLADVTAALGY